jgi:hypothetical protein
VGRFFIAAATLLAAPFVYGGTEPKAKPEEYPAHAKLAKLGIGAEYLVHSVAASSEMLFVPEYLVVEVALFPTGNEAYSISTGEFTLRVNGKKSVLFTQTPGMVAASLKYPDWGYRKGVEVGAGTDSGGVILGRPTSVERFPGDPRPGQQRLPNPPQAPKPEDRSGIEKQQPVTVDQVVTESALPEGPAAKPVSGYIYFAFKGKTKSIRTLELLYQGPAGEAVLRFF